MMDRLPSVRSGPVPGLFPVVQLDLQTLDGTNWIIFKDRFMFAAAAASLDSHVDGTGAEPTLVTGFPASGPLTSYGWAEDGVGHLYIKTCSLAI